MIRKLTPEELKAILASLDRERHLLYYSYLTFRKPRTTHYGQFTDQGGLLGVLAFLEGLPFYAFFVFPVHPSFDFSAVLAFTKKELRLPDEAIGNFIVHEEDMAALSGQMAFAKPPEKLFLMKHIHHQMLPAADPRVQRLEPSHFDRIEALMKKLGTMAFRPTSFSTLSMVSWTTSGLPPQKGITFTARITWSSEISGRIPLSGDKAWGKWFAQRSPAQERPRLRTFT
jgi:hypothetical protein